MVVYSDTSTFSWNGSEPSGIAETQLHIEKDGSVGITQACWDDGEEWFNGVFFTKRDWMMLLNKYLQSHKE